MPHMLLLEPTDDPVDVLQAPVRPTGVHLLGTPLASAPWNRLKPQPRLEQSLEVTSSPTGMRRPAHMHDRIPAGDHKPAGTLGHPPSTLQGVGLQHVPVISMLEMLYGHAVGKS